MNTIDLLYIDLFCGAGGTSTGVESARINGEQCAKVIACVNHDANAIASHAANHPEAMHFTEDIRTLELSPGYTRTTDEAIISGSSLGTLGILRVYEFLKSQRWPASGRRQPDTGRTSFSLYRIP